MIGFPGAYHAVDLAEGSDDVGLCRGSLHLGEAVIEDEGDAGVESGEVSEAEVFGEVMDAGAKNAVDLFVVGREKRRKVVLEGDDLFVHAHTAEGLAV